MSFFANLKKYQKSIKPPCNPTIERQGFCEFEIYCITLAHLAKSNLFSGETEAAMYSTSFACMPRSVSHCSLPVSIKRLHFLPSTARAVASIAFMASDNLGFEETYATACLHKQVQGSASAHPH
jgi:hypothetical protein